MKKKKLPKTATFNDVIVAINDVKKEVVFIRKDSIDMESHLTDKINQLKVQGENNHSQILDKLNQIIEQNEETTHTIKKLERIHPGGLHATL